jgi:hypothetical protein
VLCGTIRIAELDRCLRLADCQPVEVAPLLRYMFRVSFGVG